MQREHLKPSGAKSVLAQYTLIAQIDAELAEKLWSAGIQGTASAILAEVHEKAVLSAELPSDILESFGLQAALKYRFAEHIVENKQVTMLLGYSDEKRSIESVKWAESDKASPLHFPPVGSPIRTPDFARRTGLQDHQEGMVMPMLVNNRKNLVLFVRNKANGAVEQVKTASVTIQRAFMADSERLTAEARGFIKRKKIMEECQQMTPYPNRGVYRFATENLRYQGSTDEINSHDGSSRPEEYPAEEWDVYRATASIKLLEMPYAYLHSFRKRGDIRNELHDRKVPDPFKGKQLRGLGHVYLAPEHDMRVNNAWLLGLAHRGVETVLTTSLDETTIVRRSAPINEKTMEQHASALLREVVGMLQNELFTVRDGEHGKKIFTPTEKARTATLKDFQTSQQMNRAETEALLAKYGLAIKPQQPDASLPPNPLDFDTVGWLSKLLDQDLDGDSNEFPCLETCIYAGMHIPPELFGSIGQKLADAASPKQAERASRMMIHMIQGQTRIGDAYDCLKHATKALPFIPGSDLQKNMLDWIHKRAVVAQSQGGYELTSILHLLADQVIEAEMKNGSERGRAFSLMEHMLASRVLLPKYKHMPRSCITEEMYSTIPLQRKLFRPLLHAPELSEPAVAEKTIALVDSTISSVKNPERRFEMLADVVRVSPGIPQEDVRSGIMRLAMNARSHFPDSDHRRAIGADIGRALTRIEAGRSTDAHRLLEQLLYAGVPLRPDFCGTAVAENNFDLAKALLAELRTRDEKSKALMAMASEIPYIEDRQRLASLLGDLLEEKKQLTAGRAIRFLEVLGDSIVTRPTRDPARAIEQLEQFGIPVDRPLFIQSLRNIDSPRCLDPESAVRMAIALADKISSDENQQRSALLNLTRCLGNEPFIPEKSELLHTVLDHIHTASDNGQKQELQTEVAYSLARILPDLFKLPGARDLLKKCERSLGEMIEDQPRFSYLKTVFEGLNRLSNPTGNHLADAASIANALPAFRGESRALAIEQIKSQLSAQNEENNRQMDMPGVRTRRFRRAATEQKDQTDEQHSVILTTLLDSLPSFRSDEAGSSAATISLINAELANVHNPTEHLNLIRDAIALLRAPEIAQSKFFSYDDLLELIGEHLEKALRHDSSFELLNMLTHTLNNEWLEKTMLSQMPLHIAARHLDLDLDTKDKKGKELLSNVRHEIERRLEQHSPMSS
ncbi:MAG: hypothetical protein V7642_6439 [Burkholderiales bacterium]